MLSFNNLKFTYRGRVSLNIILKSMNIKQGDVVAVQSYTCSAVVEAILALKAKPLFIDINIDNLMINENDLLKKIEFQPKLKALIIQYTFGINFNPEKILKICKNKNIYLVEDCCHINPNLISENKIGLIGDACFFSFEWGKPIAAGIGGAFHIKNKNLIERSNVHYNYLRSPPLKNEILIFFQYLFFKFFYTPKTYWLIKDIYNFLSKKNLIIGNFNNLETLTRNNEFELKLLKISKKIIKKKIDKYHKQNNYNLLNKIYKKCKLDGINYKFKINKDYNIPLLRIPFFLNKKDLILSIAKKNKIELAGWYNSPVHPYNKDHLDKVGYSYGSCPNAEKISNHLVSLPINISDEHLNKFFKIIAKHD